MASIVCELQWISYLLQDLHIPLLLHVPLHCDNKVAVHISENLVFHERIKYIEIDCHIVRQKVQDGFVKTCQFSFISSVLVQEGIGQP